MPTETITKKLFTVDEFYRMSDAGILPPDGRFELIRGEIIEMPLPGSAHTGRVNRLTHLFVSKLGDAAIVSVQNPGFLDLYSMPLPDFAILKPRSDFYTEAHPTPSDILFVVEVAVTSVWYDTKVKAGLYAEFSIPEYWLLDIHKNTVIVRTEPGESDYRSVETRRRSEAFKPSCFPEVAFSVDEILGPAAS